jgi:hypothetical protein
MKKLFLPFITIIIAIYGCDKIDNPIPDDIIEVDGILWDDSSYVESSPSMRKILVEEFTGHLCTFCPDGAREIERLDSIYGGQVIPLSIHAGSFANVPANGAGFDANGDGTKDFTTNFKTPDGDDYYTTFGVASNPAATVSRLNNANITGLSQWSIDINSIKNNIPKVSIGLSTLYNDSSRTVKVVVNTQWFNTVSGNFNLQLYLLEDNIVDWQLDNGVYVQNYNHRHVFRKAINGTWGTPIPSSNAGDSNLQEFALELPITFNKNNCIVVAHIYAAGPNYEVLQAEELHVIPSH